MFAATSGKVGIDELSSGSSDHDAYGVQWRELAEAAAEPNPFFHPAMLRPAIAHLDPARQVQVIEAHGDGRLIGLLPLVARTRHSRYRVRHAMNWMHGQCFFGAPLLRMGGEVAAWAAMLKQLDTAPWAGQFLHLDGLDMEGPVVASLRACCAEQGRHLTLIAQHERALLRSGLSADDYWTTHVRAKKRKEIRRLINRLEELGAVTHRHFGPGDDLAGWTQEFLALEASGWKGEEGTALGSSGATRAYFTAALANAAQANMLDMLRIDLDGVPLTMLVNFRMGAGAFSYKIAFDERYSRFSPGVLIEIDNLRASLSDPGLEWMDSCAAPNHPMIDGIWAERRTIGQFRVALRGGVLSGLKRRAVYSAIGLAERGIQGFKGKSA